MTDEQIDALWRETEGANVHYREFARALLAAQPKEDSVHLGSPVPSDSEPAALPERVYWAPLADNFYDAEGQGQGTEFYLKWKPRRAEFPQGESWGWGKGSAHNPFKDSLTPREADNAVVPTNENDPESVSDALTEAYAEGRKDEAEERSAAPAVDVPAKRVYLVASGLTSNGRELYERYDDSPPPLCDSELLYAAEQDEWLKEAEALLDQHENAYGSGADVAITRYALLAHLNTRAQPQAQAEAREAAAYDQKLWLRELLARIEKWGQTRDGTPSKAKAWTELWEHAHNIGPHWRARAQPSAAQIPDTAAKEEPHG